MPPTIEDVVSAICSTYESLHIAGKNAFAIPDLKEAKLAFDIFTAHGMEANVYNENGAARLYVAQLGTKSMARLPQALSYAKSLKSIKHAVETLNNDKTAQTTDYSISLADSGRGKQIIIHLTPVLSEQKAPPIAATPSAITSSVPKQPVKKQSTQFDHDFFAGPQVTRPIGKFINQQKYNAGPDNYWKQMKTYVKGNSAGAVMILVTAFLGLIMAYSLFQVSKSFLCPDFIVAEQDKNRAWYCSK